MYTYCLENKLSVKVEPKDLKTEMLEERSLLMKTTMKIQRTSLKKKVMTV